MCEHLHHKSEDKGSSGSCLGSGLAAETPHTKVYTENNIIDSNCS